MKDDNERKSLYIQVRINPDDKQKLQAIADKNGVTMSGQLRMWIERSWKQMPTAPASGD